MASLVCKPVNLFCKPPSEVRTSTSIACAPTTLVRTHATDRVESKDAHCDWPHLQLVDSRIALRKMPSSLVTENADVKRALSALPYKSQTDYSVCWVIDGGKEMLGLFRQQPDTLCYLGVVRDFADFTLEGTRVTPDLVGQRGDELCNVTFRHLGVVNEGRGRYYASWCIVDRPRGMLGFETADEYAAWLAKHKAGEFKKRMAVAAQMLADAKVTLPSLKDLHTRVELANAWFRVYDRRKGHERDGFRKVGESKRFGTDDEGRIYLWTVLDDDRARMAQWSSVEPPSTLASMEVKSGERNVLAWVSCDPLYHHFRSTEGGGTLPPPRSGTRLGVVVAGVAGTMHILEAAMCPAEPVGWVYARVSNIPFL